MDRLETDLTATLYAALRQPEQNVLGDLTRDHGFNDVTEGMPADSLRDREVSDPRFGIQEIRHGGTVA
ncbi:hypothetical protein ACIBK8_24285 [Streptomyces sp. NPDC050161]|uniref:hypothetical protein n=1 Tax=Streptomyces sp. NPDC050161 TaxID=3365604 RepID=UPI0037B6A272